MGIFGSIMDKLFHHSTAQAATPSQTASQPTSGTAGAGQQAQAGTAAQQPQTGSSAMGTAMSPRQPRLQNVDVEAVLIQLASTKGGGGNWRTSVVDLLKLLDLDSSSAARQRSRQRAQRACRRRRQCRTKYRASESRHGENRRKRRQSTG